MDLFDGFRIIGVERMIFRNRIVLSCLITGFQIGFVASVVAWVKRVRMLA